ncbi:MAG: hypothetical protein KHX14_10345 [[Clostridium] spiroforme]|uniref:DUF6630 domain-containing protein n=1 Tax=Thomasclavelia spiroformis TaxID=29348 RepID=A0A943EM16_9FIRM|nr:DUF6630 family protein [Thomasclavelia spiroformis]MBS5589182.1 hypothetical protein [Thomasclavelia spiroformis]
MGLFDRFKKEKIYSMATEKKCDNELLEIVRNVSFNNEAILKNAQNYIENTIEYYQNHLTDYEDRGISNQDKISFLQWVGCIDLLKSYGYVCECDWKESKDEFLLQISTLKEIGLLGLKINSNWLDKEQDIPGWCAKLEEKWGKLNGVIGAFDIDSDSYVMFICKKEDLEILMVLAEKFGYRIDYAKNM